MRVTPPIPSIDPYDVPPSIFLAHQWAVLSSGSCASITEFVHKQYTLYRISCGVPDPLSLLAWLDTAPGYVEPPSFVCYNEARQTALRHHMKFSLPDLEQLQEIYYCVNCTDKNSRLFGYFAYDNELFQMGLGMWSIGPVFDTVDELYSWARGKGFFYHSLKDNFVLCKHFPT